MRFQRWGEKPQQLSVSYAPLSVILAALKGLISLSVCDTASAFWRECSPLSSACMVLIGIITASAPCFGTDVIMTDFVSSRPNRRRLAVPKRQRCGRISSIKTGYVRNG